MDDELTHEGGLLICCVCMCRVGHEADRPKQASGVVLTHVLVSFSMAFAEKLQANHAQLRRPWQLR